MYNIDDIIGISWEHKCHVDKYLDNVNPATQIDILQEECAELIQALSKFKRRESKDTMPSIVEEMTHVLISISAVAAILGISEDDIYQEIKRKNDLLKEGCVK